LAALSPQDELDLKQNSPHLYILPKLYLRHDKGCFTGRHCDGYIKEDFGEAIGVDGRMELGADSHPTLLTCRNPPKKLKSTMKDEDLAKQSEESSTSLMASTLIENS
jgi:hypothetical protein